MSGKFYRSLKGDWKRNRIVFTKRDIFTFKSAAPLEAVYLAGQGILSAKAQLFMWHQFSHGRIGNAIAPSAGAPSLVANLAAIVGKLTGPSRWAGRKKALQSLGRNGQGSCAGPDCWWDSWKGAVVTGPSWPPRALAFRLFQLPPSRAPPPPPPPPPPSPPSPPALHPPFSGRQRVKTREAPRLFRKEERRIFGRCVRPFAHQHSRKEAATRPCARAKRAASRTRVHRTVDARRNLASSPPSFYLLYSITLSLSLSLSLSTTLLLL
jgi:hypothetical protein